MSTDEKRLAKIRALLAKAESTTFPEEAKTFTAKAQELMVEWAIDDAMISQFKDAEKVEITTVRIDLNWGPFLTPQQTLLNGLATVRDCKAIMTSYKTWNDSGTGKIHVCFIDLVGFPRDLEFVQMLYTSLRLQSQSEFLTDAVQARMVAETSHPGHRTRWRNGFMMGYNAEVIRRLWEVRRATEETAEGVSPGVGLVLADRKSLVESEFERLHPERRTIHARAGESAGSSQDLGREAGSRSDIGNTRVSGNRAEIGS
jgi:hypothetical protein